MTEERLDDEQADDRSLMRLLADILRGRRRVQSEKELQQIIDESEQEGIINEDEGDMLQSIFEFGDTIVREIMLPRTEMVCLDQGAPIQQFLDAIIDSGHSRIPVFHDSPDHIVGVVYAKDLLRYWGAHDDQLAITAVMRPAYFIPETKKIEELLQEFRVKRVHMAIVVDEYGGTSGLVTIEDLLEEIVGDIQDEYDLEEEMIQPQSDGSVVIHCLQPIDEFEDYFQVEIASEHFDTVGGYIVDRFGRVPTAGEQFEDGLLRITVDASDDRAVRRVRVERLTAVAADGNDE